MKTYPLQSISLEQAKQLQFKIVDAVTRHFDGNSVLTTGDLGVVMGQNKPSATIAAEKVFADAFDAQAALFVRGSGTGAIRWALIAAMQKQKGALLVHRAPIYPTTRTTIETMGIQIVEADFNDPEDLAGVLKKQGNCISAALVQHTRQKVEDRYQLGEVIRQIKKALPQCTVITDDNYAALKVEEIGCQCGADLSTFSCFKTLGPEGVGVLLGRQELVDCVRGMQYSGGSQVQGHEAMCAVRGIIYAPVALAIQSQVGEELVQRLNAGEVPGVKHAFLANAQSKVVLVELKSPLAKRVLKAAPRYGAAPHPVGSESIYEFAPMIYRVSGTFRAEDPSLETRMLRINPMRSGADTVIRILHASITEAEKEEAPCS